MRLFLLATLFTAAGAANTLTAHLALPYGAIQWAYNSFQLFGPQVSLPNFETNEKIVPSLTLDTFEDFLDEHDIAFINFYNGSGNSNFLAPEWEAFAEEVMEEGLPIGIARVNCDKETKLCEDEEVKMFPLLRWYEFIHDTTHNFNGAFKTTDELIALARTTIKSSPRYMRGANSTLGASN